MKSKLIRMCGACGIALVLLLSPTKVIALEGCKPYPVTEYSPTGIVGCVVYGEGTASMWGGPGAARNDCIYPWTNCQMISVRSLQTGKIIYVTPTMFCDCYTGTPNQRIVDLDRTLVLKLGLDPDQGLWPVEVQPVDQGIGIPDTAMKH